MTAPYLLLLIQAIATGGGSITGTLRDASSNEPLSGAQVVIDFNHVIVTDTGGRYRVVRVPPGTHRLLVRRVGYAPRTLDVLVPADGTVEVSVALRAEPVELGAVEGGENSAWPVPSDRQVDGSVIRTHPLLAEPDVLQTLSGGIVLVQPESPSGMHIRGGGSDQVTYLLDGFPVLSPYHSGESFSAWNPDALAGAALQPSSETWDALSGVVSATSRTPGRQPHVASAFTTTQMRLTVDGRFGPGGSAGFLWSERSAFPGFPAPQHDPTYLHGEIGDRLVKVEAPVVGGRLRLLGYTSENELDTQGATGTTPRNTFAWQSTTLGGEWSAPWRSGVARARVWSAGQDASATWQIVTTSEQLNTRRRDAGLTFAWERSGQRGRTALGTRLQTSRTAYTMTADSGVAIRYASDAPLAAVFVERSQTVGSRTGVMAGLTATQSAGAARLSPRAWLYWTPVDGLLVSGAYLRLYQFAQSLRNPESVAGTVFPVELFVGATRGAVGGGVPIARSDAEILTVEYRPAAELRLSAQAYLRAFDDVALVAPRSRDPFATAPFWTGSGTARGITLDLTRATRRATLVVSYGRQYTRFWYGANSYVPDYAATDAVDAGIALHPGRHISIRAAASGRFGRRATALTTPFEWESCNITDRGCEFAGSPRTSDTLSAISLPGYLRFDLGLRTHWSVRVGSRLTELGLFGTFTNLFARTNVLTMAPDPATGSAAPVPLRSRVPLVVGVDWAF